MGAAIVPAKLESPVQTTFVGIPFLRHDCRARQGSGIWRVVGGDDVLTVWSLEEFRRRCYLSKAI
jgi:hypothetical protein